MQVFSLFRFRFLSTRSGATLSKPIPSEATLSTAIPSVLSNAAINLGGLVGHAT